MVPRGQQVTLASLAGLAGLANAKGIYGGPYSLYGPMFVVDSEEEMLRLTQANPDGYAVRRDLMQVYKYSAGGWIATQIRALEGLPGAGATVVSRTVSSPGAVVGFSAAGARFPDSCFFFASQA